MQVSEVMTRNAECTRPERCFDTKQPPYCY